MKPVIRWSWSLRGWKLKSTDSDRIVDLAAIGATRLEEREVIYYFGLEAA